MSLMSRKTIYWSAGAVAIYFGVFGIQNGLLLLFSVSAFAIGGRTGSSHLLNYTLLLCAILLLHVTTSSCSADVECSQSKSRQARAIVTRVVEPRYKSRHVGMPTTCPLSPANDRYAAEEQMKRRLGSKWLCSVCGKSYADEGELDSHLAGSHVVHRANGCLADHCDILRCEPYFDVHRDNVDCDEKAMEKLKLRCMNMIRDECSPSYLSAAERLQLEVTVQASICSYLTCSEYWTIAEEEESHAEHYYYTTYAIALCVLLIFLVIYFKIASSNIDNSVSIEQILAEADKYERVKPAVIQPEGMEIRHRNPAAQQQWLEEE